MADCLKLDEYVFEKGVFKGKLSKGSLALTGIYFLNSKKGGKISGETYEDGDGTLTVSLDFDKDEIASGTWKLVALSCDGRELYCGYRDCINDKEVGRMIELGLDTLYCNPENKYHYMGALDANSNFTVRKWHTNSSCVKKNTLYIKKYEVNDGRVSFTTIEKLVPLQAEIWLWSRSQKRITRIKVDNISDGCKFDILFDKFAKENEDTLGKLFEVFLVTNTDGRYVVSRIELKNKHTKKVKGEKKAVPDDSGKFVMTYELAEDKVCHIYFDQLYKLCAKVIEKRQRYKGIYRAELKDYCLKDGSLKLSFSYNRKDFDNRRILIRHYSELDNKTYEYNIEASTKDNEFVINMKDIDWTSLRYDILFLADKDGYTYEFRIIARNEGVVKKLSNIYGNLYTADNGMIVYLTETIGDLLVIECRETSEYDGLTYRINEWIAERIAGLFYRIKIKKKICMFYEKFCTAAQDNSYYMFDYFYNHPKMNIEPVYVLAKDSPDYKWMKKKYGKSIIRFMSIKHLIYLQIAKVFVSTDSKRHCYRWRSGNTKISRILNVKKFVFLQHGVIGFKKVDNIYGKQYANSADMFISVSEFEKELIERYFGYKKKEIEVTGLARWDALEDKSVPGDNMIFYMPTWRNWIYEADAKFFEQTDYYKKYYEIINSKKLVDILEKNDAYIIFCLHAKFKKYSPMFKSTSDRIKIVSFDECRVNELLMKCRMLITDYSSVSWDVFYQEKPVLFYQFDADKYMEKQGSYLPLDKKVFGERAATFEDFTDKLSKLIENDYRDLEDMSELREKYLPLRDNNNCERIYKAVMELIR